MLGFLRAFAKSWVALALLALLGFALLGLGSTGTFSLSFDRLVGTVGDRDLQAQDFNRDFQQRIMTAQRILQRPVTVQEALDAGVHEATFGLMVNNAAMAQEARRLGFAAPDDAVARRREQELPQLMGTALPYSRALYEDYLGQTRQRARDFEDRVRDNLARESLLRAFAQGLTPPRLLSETLTVRDQETRTVSYLQITADQVEAPADPDEETLRAYYDDNLDAFTAPEYRGFAYLLINPAALAANVEIDADAVRAEYDTRVAAGTYVRAAEQRMIQTLRYDDRAAADAALARTQEGATFAALAEGADAGRLLDLGLVTRDDPNLRLPIAEAAFALSEAGVAGPVETPLGVFVVNVRAMIPADVIPFESVQSAVRRELALAQVSEGTIVDLARQAEDKVLEGETFEEIAAALGVQAGVIEQVDAQGRDYAGAAVTLPQNTGLLAAAFEIESGDAAVLTEGDNDAQFFIELADVTALAPRPFDEVRDGVLDLWRADQIAAAQEIVATEIKAELEAGTEMVRIAADRGLEVNVVEGVTRATPAPQPLSAAAMTELMSAEAGVVLTAAARAAAAGWLVARVDAVERPDPADLTDAIEQRQTARARALRQEQSSMLIQHVVGLYPVTRNMDVILRQVEAVAAAAPQP